MDPPPFSSILHNWTDATVAASELAVFCQFVDLSDLKVFFQNQIDKMDAASTRTAYYGVSSINNILSSDVMQIILSFGHSNQNRSVCKQWNRINIQNEKNMLQTMYRSAMERYPMPFAPKSDTWVLHPNRPSLHAIQIEKKMGFKGPLSAKSLYENALVGLKPGDRVLVHHGEYTLPVADINPCLPPNLTQRVHLVGLTPRSRERARISLDHTAGELYRGQYTFDRLCVAMPLSGMRVLGSLTMRYCNVETSKVSTGITADNGGSLEIRNCKLIGGNTEAVRVGPKANTVNISKTVFKRFAQGIVIGSADDGEISDLLRISITDNVFEEIAGPPVSELGRSGQDPLIVGTDRCYLAGNTCVEPSAYDPNKPTIQPTALTAPRTPVTPDSDFD